nr:class I SAM-dependent methyltransferase [Pantoea sp. 201603H]
MTAKSHHQHVEAQFGDRAQAYLSSAVHATGHDLQRLSKRLSATPESCVLDLGCGAGHASFIAAEQVRNVVAYDLSSQMLDVVKRTASERGYSHLKTEQGYAESLPFPDETFDIVISRYSAHHWHDVGQALREVKRVLKPAGAVIFMDVSSPGNAVLDIWLQTIEALRDTSHVRDYSPGEWLNMFTEAGLMINRVTQDRLSLEFSNWVTRMRTPETLVTAIRAYQQSASDEVKRYYMLQDDGSFTSDTLFIEAYKA